MAMRSTVSATEIVVCVAERISPNVGQSESEQMRAARACVVLPMGSLGRKLRTRGAPKVGHLKCDIR